MVQARPKVDICDHDLFLLLPLEPPDVGCGYVMGREFGDDVGVEVLVVQDNRVVQPGAVRWGRLDAFARDAPVQDFSVAEFEDEAVSIFVDVLDQDYVRFVLVQVAFKKVGGVLAVASIELSDLEGAGDSVLLSGLAEILIAIAHPRQPLRAALGNKRCNASSNRASCGIWGTGRSWHDGWCQPSCGCVVCCTTCK